jgi:processing peptidase subunit alpha
VEEIRILIFKMLSLSRAGCTRSIHTCRIRWRSGLPLPLQLLVPVHKASEVQTQSAERRSFSASSDAFSIYEYPTRTEAPVITSSNAKDVSAESIDAATSSSTTSPKLHSPKDDPFDDGGKLGAEEREKVRKQQNQTFGSLKLSSLPIAESVPDFIPPNVPSGELKAPETIITTLDNGIRVVSQETYGQMCTFGVLTNVGSRHEPTSGIVHLLETMAFGSTKSYDGLEITQLLQDWGATRFVSHSREQTLHCIDILRPNVKNGMQLLADVVLEPLINDSPEDFLHAKAVLEFQAQEQPPELVLGEALQVAAYGSDQQLGKLHFATPDTIPQLTPDLVQDFYAKNIRNNPEGMVIAGAGISHDELVDLARDSFGHIKQQSAPTTIPSVYKGGSHFVGKPAQSSIYTSTLPEEDYCRVALAFPVGGWHSDSMVTACVLQTLLGGGSSFSAGGPGKGMYSRMYQQVLNRYGWMETAEAFTTFADEGGLFGVSASTPVPGKVGELVTILADQLARLAVQPVSDVELSRARNMLKCNVLTQLESRLILFEDMARQVLTYDKREDAATTCRKIDSVSAKDIQALAQEMLQQHPPTLAATGSHLDQVPTSEEVARWFQ